MAERIGFLDKFIHALDKIDQKSLQQYVMNIIKERDAAYALLGEVPCGVLVLNEKERILFINVHARDMFMRSHAEKTTTLAQICEDSDLYRFLHGAVKNKGRLLHVPFDMIKPHEKHLRVSVIPLQQGETEAGVVFLIVCMDRCIERESELRYREESIESQAKLAAGVAHEIGNPLNTINIYLDIIKKKCAVKDYAAIDPLLNTISEETKRLDKIVKNFLTVTRNHVTLFRKGNINRCIEEVIEFFRPECEMRQIVLDVHLQDSIQPFYMDSERLYEAFVNVIKNAIEAMPHGGVLEITTTAKAGVVSIAFVDSGEGIHDEDLPHIFDAYYTTKAEGSGLGLMNVYSIIKAHGGRIHVESQRNEGTTVLLTIPMKRDKLQLPYASSIKTDKKEGKSL